MRAELLPTAKTTSAIGNERWRDLCALASTEHDPDKFLKLVHEINELLEEKEKELKTALWL